MKYLFCYDVHNSEEHRNDYERIIENMKERFRPVLRFTESVYIFETELVDMDDLRHRIQEIVGFEDLEFYVFRLVDEMDMVTTIKYCREMIEYCQEENRRMFAELNNE